MKDKLKQFIDMYYIDGKKYQSIVSKLGLKPGQVQKLYAKSKKSLDVKEIKRIKSVYGSIKRRNGGKIKWHLSDFVRWNQEAEQNGCEYCRSSIKDVREFFKKRPNKRSTRGYSFEVDKKNALKGYCEKNCVLACYVCNNAKSDFLSPKAFKPIADGIAITIKKNLK